MNDSYDLSNILICWACLFLIHVQIITYQGDKGDYLIKSMKRTLKKILSNNVKPE